MKICLISFDFWGFDRHIIRQLENQNINASHINLLNFKYRHPSLLHRIGNLFDKLIFKKNIKKIKRQEYVLEELNKLGPQDIILIIRPDLLDRKTHEVILQKTKKYIAYLYDSTERFPVEHLLEGLFDKIFSFDGNDVKKYGFEHISNYIYLPKQEIKPQQSFKHKVFIVIAADERLAVLNKVAGELDNLKISYKFIVVNSRQPQGLNPKIEYRKKAIWHDELMTYLNDSEIFLDLVRDGHNGLSFRVFEAMAYQKKLITTNASIKNYDFYNPNNIMVIDAGNPVINPNFFNSPYQPLPDSVYNKYTIENWVNRVFL